MRDRRAGGQPSAGKSAAFALGSTAEGSYSLGADDYRTGWLTDLGFTVPKTSAEVSFEQLDVFEADVLIAEGVEDAAVKNPLFARLPPVRGGVSYDSAPSTTTSPPRSASTPR